MSLSGLMLLLVLMSNLPLELELFSGELSSSLERRVFLGLFFDFFSWLDFSNSLNLSSRIGG